MQSKSSRGVQQKDVWGAADALIAEGLRPTIERVRQKMGRGSPNTVSPMLEAWFTTLAPRLGVGAAISASDGGQPPEVRKAADDLWQTALSLAQTRATTALQADRAALSQERLDLTTANTALEAALDQMAQREVMLRNALTGAQAQAEERNRDIERLRTELGHSQAEVAAGRGVIARQALEHDAERSRLASMVEAQLKAVKASQDQAATDQRRLLEEVDRARQEAKQLRVELVASAKKHETVREALERDNQQLSQTVGSGKVVVAALQEKLAAAELRVKDFQGVLKSAATSSRSPARKRTKKE